MNEIGRLIQALRNERKMSQGELGDLIGCSKQTVSNYENGRRRPAFEVLEAICDIFNVPRAYFFTEEEKRAELQKIYSDTSYKCNNDDQNFSARAAGIAYAFDNLNSVGKELIESAMKFALKHHAQRSAVSTTDIPLPRIGTVHGVPLFQMPDDMRLPTKLAAAEELKELNADVQSAIKE